MRSISVILLLFINILLLSIACSSSTNQQAAIDPMDAAMPHGATLPSTSLSVEDKKKLANAKGIVATPILVKDLVYLIEEGSQNLNIYCLWKLNSPECDKLLKSLTQLKQEIGSDIMAIHHVNANYIDDEDKVTSHIRELGLINNNYMLFGLEEYDNDQPYSTLFKGELPILILVNKSEGLKLIYQKAFTFDELYAIISPLTI
ncbi:MAG: hypothetical protein ACI8YQ_001913 [Polaribacter sp.]|jgi:hypothetical protein